MVILKLLREGGSRIFAGFYTIFREFIRHGREGLVQVSLDLIGIGRAESSATGKGCQIYKQGSKKNHVIEPPTLH